MIQNINQFLGMRPVVHPTNLPDNNAADCADCYFTSTGLDPLRALKLVSNGFSGVKSLHKANNQLVGIHADVNSVRSPIINDLYNRLYFTTSGANPDLYVTTEAQFAKANIAGRRLADFTPPIPNIDTHLSRWSDGTPQVVYVFPQPFIDKIESGEYTGAVPPGATYMAESEMDAFTTFVYTFVTDMGEESAPSMPSKVQGYLNQADYRIHLAGIPFSGYAYVVKRNIYMEVDGDYFLVAEIENNDPIFSYYLPPFNSITLGKKLNTTDYDAAPTGLQGLVGLPCGSLAAFINKGSTGTICLSEPYQPHAYPVKYRFKSLYPIVGLAVVPEGLLVLTKGYPLLISGGTPSVMVAQVIESSAACLSKTSIVVRDGTCYWSSPDGVASFGSDGIAIQTRGVWSREQWQTLQPSSALFAVYEDVLLIYLASSAWLLSLARQDVSRLSETGVTCALYDVEEDRLYMVRGNDLNAFGEGEHLTGKWYSKHFVQSMARSWTSGRIEADNYPLRLALNAGDSQALAEVSKKTIINNHVFRLTATGRKRIVQFGLETQYRVRLVQMAHTMQEIT